jgi:subtilase family serine protease
MRFARPAVAAAGSALLAAAVSGAGAVAPAVGTAAGSAGSLAAIVSVRPGIVHALAAQPVPPTTAFCERRFKIACYLPRQIQRAYHLPALFRKGVDGKGQTIVIVDSFGSPTVRRDLRVFDAAAGLPAPPSLRVIQPAGRVP